MKKENMTYKAAKAEIEDIISRIESNELDVDELTKHVKRASTLVDFCKQRLLETDKELQKVIEKLSI